MDSLYKSGPTVKLLIADERYSIHPKYFGKAHALMIVNSQLPYLKDAESTNLKLEFKEDKAVFYFTTIQRIDEEKTMCKHWIIYIKESL